MVISNTNRRKIILFVLGILMLISLADLVFARVDGRLNDYFWGYLFILSGGTVMTIYAIFGLPMVTVDTTSEILEISTSFVLFKGIRRTYYINRVNITDYSIKDYLFWKQLKLTHLSEGRTEHLRIGISFMSSEAVKKLQRNLKEMIRPDESGTALFI